MTTLLGDAAATLARAAAGTAAAVAVGAPLGLALGLLARRPGAGAATSRIGERLLDAVRATPPIAVYPLLLVLFGYGEGARLLAVVFGAAGLVALQVAASVADAAPARREVLAQSGAGPWQRLCWLEVPAALPAVLLGCRAAFSIALVVVLVSEMLVGAEAGLGRTLALAMLRFDRGALVLAVLLVGAVGAGSSAALAVAARTVTRRLGA